MSAWWSMHRGRGNSLVQTTSRPRVSDSHIGYYRVSDSRGSVNGGRGRRRRSRGGRKEKARKERRLLSSAVPSPPAKTVRVRPAPRPNLPDSSDDSEGGVLEAFLERRTREDQLGNAEAKAEVATAHTMTFGPPAILPVTVGPPAGAARLAFVGGEGEDDFGTCVVAVTGFEEEEEDENEGSSEGGVPCAALLDDHCVPAMNVDISNPYSGE